MPVAYPPAPPPPPPVPSSDEPRLSKIEDLLAAQQGNLARLLREQAAANDGAETKHLFAVTSEYNKFVRELTRSLKQEKRHGKEQKEKLS